MESKNYDNQYKLLLIGDSAVGKTSILLRFVDSSFYDNYVATIGIDYKIKNVMLDDKIIRLQIWDTAGQERFRTITAAYFRKAMGILLTYDITDQKSFNSVTIWLQNIQKTAPEDIQLVLIGNKCDLNSERVVSFEQGEELAKTHNIKFFEVSAKENININEAFISLTKSIKDKQEGVVEADPVSNEENSNNETTVEDKTATTKSPPKSENNRITINDTKNKTQNKKKQNSNCC